MKYYEVFIYSDMFIYVLICNLLAYTVSNGEHVVLNDVTVNTELKKKIWAMELSYNLNLYISIYITYQLRLKQS